MEQKINELEINGVIYVPKGTQIEEPIRGDIKIVILQRGWVMVGRLTKEGSECELSYASVIRSWGTTRGLGEIAKSGPIQGKTVLDKCHGVVNFDWLTVVATISCEENKWANEL